MIKYVLIDPKATVLELVSRLYGDLGFTYKFLQDNNFIGGVDVSLDNFTGINVAYDDALTNLTPARLRFDLPLPNPTILNWAAQPGQSLYDLCIQTYGTLDNLYKLIQDNSVDGINGNIESGQYYNFDTTLMNGTAIYKNNLKQGTIYATNVPLYAGIEWREDEADETREDGTLELRD